MYVDPSMGKQEKSIHYSFRTNKEILLSLEKEAEEKGITTSNLLNQIMKNYVKRDKFFVQLGFVPIGKDILRIWLNRIDKEHLQEVARNSYAVIGREYISYIFHDVNKNTVIQFLDIWLRTFGEVQKKIHDKMCSFAVNHGISIQYSLHLKEFLCAIIESTISKRVNFVEITPNLLSFSFEIE